MNIRDVRQTRLRIKGHRMPTMSTMWTRSYVRTSRIISGVGINNGLAGDGINF